MATGVRTVVYPVTDLDRAKRSFGVLLAAAPTTDTPYYVGFTVDGQEIGLNPGGAQQGMTAPVPYFHVDDISACIDALTADGAELQQPATDVGAGRLIASMTDADGNLIGLLQDPAA